MITILGRKIPHTLDELTIEQFETITEIGSNKEIDNIDRHLQIFASLGIAESEFYDYDVAEFITIVKAFNEQPKTEYPVVETIELDGFTYTAQLKLTVRDTKLIESIAIKKPKGYISSILAIMFKADHLTLTEHYADAHLKLKAKHIGKLKACIAIPYLMFIANKINKQVDDQATQAVE